MGYLTNTERCCPVTQFGEILLELFTIHFCFQHTELSSFICIFVHYTTQPQFQILYE